MTPDRRLRCLHKALRRRVGLLRMLLEAARRLGAGHSREAMLAFIVIELQATWANFMRSYYLSCMFGAVSGRGSRIRTRFPTNNEDTAIGLAILQYRPRAHPRSHGAWRRRDEPAWHDPHTLLTLCDRFQFSNRSAIEGALSTGDRTFIDLPVFRNHFGHRDGHSQQAVQNLAPMYGLPSYLRPSHLLLTRPLKRTQTLVEDFMDAVVFAAEYMCD